MHPPRFSHLVTVALACSISLAGLLAGPITITNDNPPAQQPDVLRSYLAPAASVEYDHDFRMSLKDAPGNISMNEYQVGVPLPPLITDTFVLIANLDYHLYDMDLNTSALQGHADLHSLSMPIEAAWISPNTPWVGLLYVEPGLSTDFNLVNSNSFDLTAGLGVGYRFSSDFFLALGVAYTRNYGYNQVLPAAAMLWNVTKDFAIILSPDGFVPRWKITDDLVVDIRVTALGGRWTVKDSADEPREIRLRGVTAAFEVEQRLFMKCWLTLGVGANFLSDLRISEGNSDSILSSDLKSGLVLRSGLKWQF